MSDLPGFVTDNIDYMRLSNIAFGETTNLVLFFDDKRRIIYSNPAAASFFQASTADEVEARFAQFKAEDQPDGVSSIEYLMQKFDEAEANARTEFEIAINQNNKTTFFRAIIKCVTFDNSYLFVITGNDLTSFKETELRMERQERHINLLNNVSDMLLSTDYDGFDAAMEKAVEFIGRAFDDAMTALCKLESVNGVVSCSVVCEWHLAGMPEPNQNLPVSWLDDLEVGKLTHITLSKATEEEAVFMRKYGFLTMLMTPIVKEDIVWGFLGLAFNDYERIFNDIGIRALLGIGNLLASGIMRNQSTGMLYEAHNINSVLLESNPFSSLMVDENINIIDCNMSTRNFFKQLNVTDLKSEFLSTLNSMIPVFQPNGRASMTLLDWMKVAFVEGYCEFETCLMVLGKPLYYNIIMKRVIYKNQMVIVIYMFDLTAQKEVQHALEYHNSLLQELSSVANMLLTADAMDLNKTMNKVLEMIGKVASVDRSYIWKNSTGEDGLVYTSQIYEWSPFVEPQQDNAHAINIPFDEVLPNWKETLLQGECLNTLARNAAPQQQARLAPQGVVSILMVPIFMQDKFWGFIGFDDCHDERIFTSTEENVLRICGFMTMAISDAIQNEMSMHLLAKREEALIIAQVKTNFLANMSHEIRTPMNAILGMIELIMHENVSDIVMSHSTDIRNACRGLLAIINDILDISKIESGKLEINPVRYYVSSLLADVISIVKMRADKKTITFAVDIDPNIPSELIGDELRIKQVLINLLNNAVKFTPEGHITLSVGCTVVGDTCQLVFSVQDTGIGIKPGDVEKIFVLFEQIDTKKNREIEGTGLGLSISKQLVEMMDGSIAVESEYGVGSKFTAVINQPVANHQPVTALKHPKEISVLVYENRPTYLNSITLALEALDCNYMLCANRSEINRYLDDYKFDYLFISSLYINKIQSDAAKKQPDAVMIVLNGDGSAYNNVLSISMPIHCLQIANILNDEYDKYDIRTDMSYVASIVAPNAKVLVVDDNAVNLKVAVGLLSIYKIKADTASGGMRAVEMVKKTDYDLIFMDHMMPDMDGIDTTVAIRALGDKFARLPIIALTANAIGGVREMFKAEGLNDFLAKPIEMAKLNATLKRWLPQDKQVKGTFTAAIDEVYPAIPGVDTRRGITNSGGTPEVYNEILTIYVNDCEKRLIDLETHYSENDIKALAICVHALKSSSANIGAVDVSLLASELEAAGKSDDVNYIDMNLHIFLDALSLLLTHIRTYINSVCRKDEVCDKAADVELLRKSLEEITVHMANFDLDIAESILKTLYTYQWDAGIYERIKNIKEHIDIFDYDGVEVAIAELKAMIAAQ